MPSSKRKTRRKEVDVEYDNEFPDSSPSKPSATKRRKVNGAQPSPARRAVPSGPLPEQPDVDDDSTEEDSEMVANNELIESVISYLGVSKDPVAAQTQHANVKTSQNAQKVNAYAKIAGRDWTYFVLEQNINIGRPPDKDASSSIVSSPAGDLKELSPVHIDLGPNKVVSRHHASIFYDGDYPEGGGWHVRVNGRNGVRLNTVLLKRGATSQIKCGDVMEIAGSQMMFVTPGDKAVIHPLFIERATQLADGNDPALNSHTHLQGPLKPMLNAGDLYPTTGSQQPLAPAPPYFKRTTTPPPRSETDSSIKQSPMYNRGMVMESTQEIDYSKDSAKDLKPPYSYAAMIAQAIFSSEEEKLTLSNIYSWIQDKYSFYRHSASGWQNSIRHNLSLNKAFQKVPRRTDEPGKGMKWQVAPEFRNEYLKKQGRKGNTSSSAPTSPAAPGKEAVNPNFRGANGQNLGYDSSYVGSFSARMEPASPAYKSYGTQQAREAFTPERGGGGGGRRRGDTVTTAPEPDLDDSPLPSNARAQQNPAFGGFSAQGAAHSPPTLSSSYLDTPFASQHMITPAPRRQNVKLAPPSTLVAPSKFMPESSPAVPGTSLFWKGLMGSTPAGPRLPDISPLKRDDDGDDGIMPSSSPPPMIGESGSPTKRHPPPPRRNPLLTRNDAGEGQGSNGVKPEDDDEGAGGFDLARGFQPIGSFHSHSSQQSTKQSAAAK